jgi:threonine dehydratase
MQKALQTPHEEYGELAKEMGLPADVSVFFKREDLHPLGSHKGRSLPLMIDTKRAAGYSHFAISSSGNAALAAALHIKKLNQEGSNITLQILAGKHIDPHKLKKLEALKDSHILLSQNDRPLQTLFMKTQDPSIQSLRQSTDDSALIGYEFLGLELLQIPNLSAVFMGTSSGTTAQALADYFKKEKKNIEVHIVQTSSCHPIADTFVPHFSSEEKSIADAIVDQTAARKEAVVGKVKGGWIVMNEEIRIAQDITKRTTGLSISTNSALSVAGLMQAVYTGKEFKGAVACMICGD